MQLSQIQIDTYLEQGFLVLENFAVKEECEALRERAMQMVAKNEPSDKVSIFTTNEQSRHSDRYFLESGDKIRLFFEEEVFDSEGDLVQSKEQSINKIGHTLHDLDPLFESISRNESGNGTEMEVWDDTPWETGKAVPLEVPQGTLVILHGRLPHMSEANRSSRTRHAYTLHLIEAEGHYP